MERNVYRVSGAQAESDRRIAYLYSLTDFYGWQNLDQFNIVLTIHLSMTFILYCYMCHLFLSL